MNLEAIIIAIWLKTLAPTSDFYQRWQYGEAISKTATAYECQPGVRKVCWRGSRLELIAALGTQGYFESKFDERIQAGKCTDTECDSRVVIMDGKRHIVHLARTTWQLHNVTERSRQLWDDMVGNEFAQIANAADAAAYHLSLNRCRGNYDGMFAAMSGKGCAPTEKGKRRAAWYRREMARLRKLMVKHGR
jgi:hypothetical protein